MPLVARTLGLRDKIGTIGARSGFSRNNYKVTPGLYGIGKPTPQSQVIVTANYKLTFDTVRSTLSTLDAWLLVVDTRGINVWCAAGKKTFSAEEIIYQVQRERLAEVVSHRTMILPQLAAVGVSVRKLKQCGFKGKFGPIRIADLPEYLAADMQANESMRSITFSFKERSVLIPVEVGLLAKPLAIMLPIAVLLSGFGPGLYSLRLAADRGLLFVIGTLLAVVAGTIVTPLCLPWLPGRQFWFKGILSGLPAAFLILALAVPHLGLQATLGLMFWVVAASSYMAMNFTGATPFTSLSGVEKEMRRGLPIQLISTAAALILWVAGPFFS